LLVACYFSGALNVNPSNPRDPDRDRIILSKGHGAMALYSVLAYRGYFPREDLLTFNREGSRFQEHPGPHTAPGIEVATGSLGHGFAVGLGMAVAARSLGKSYRVAAIISDGECNEGSTWEAALFAAANRLTNVIVLVDYNKWQATGRSDEILALRPLREKWAVFGWDAVELNGHDMGALVDYLYQPPSNRPRIAVCHTVKGKGCSFMEDDNNWHYRVPTAEEVELARKELGLA
jgi:transketolase